MTMLTQAQSLQALADIAAERRGAEFVKSSKATSVVSDTTSSSRSTDDDIDGMSVDSDVDLLSIDSDFEEDNDEDKGIDLLGIDSDVGIGGDRNDVAEPEKKKSQPGNSFSDISLSKRKVLGSDKRRKASSTNNLDGLVSEGSKCTKERSSRRGKTQLVNGEGNRIFFGESNHQKKSPGSGRKQIRRTRSLKGSPVTNRSPRRPISRQMSEGWRMRHPTGSDLLKSQTAHTKIVDETVKEDIGSDSTSRLRISASAHERRARRRKAGSVSPVTGSHHEITGTESPKKSPGRGISPRSRSNRNRRSYRSRVASQMVLLAKSAEDLDDESESEVPEFAEEDPEETQDQTPEETNPKEQGLLKVSNLLGPAARIAAKIATKAVNKSGLVNKSVKLAKSSFGVMKETTENTISSAAGHENDSEMAPKAA